VAVIQLPGDWLNATFCGVDHHVNYGTVIYPVFCNFIQQVIITVTVDFDGIFGRCLQCLHTCPSDC
jgi:hypothetical protein